jgi:hypothetical protein
MDKCTFRGEKEPTCHTSQARQALPGAAALTPCHVLGPNQVLPHVHIWMNKIDQGNVGLIEWMEL